MMILIQLELISCLLKWKNMTALIAINRLRLCNFSSNSSEKQICIEIFTILLLLISLDYVISPVTHQEICIEILRY